MKINSLNNRKLPKESSFYFKISKEICTRIKDMIKNAILNKNNKIFIRTNLKQGLPLENINKVAGPFIEAWAVEKLKELSDQSDNKYGLINVEAGKRSNAYDMILQFQLKTGSECVSANVDVKSTAEDIITAGKSPNITSFARIRNEYLDDPDYIFLILSLKYKIFSEKTKEGMTNGVMQVNNYYVYDIKYVSKKDLDYNPSLGTGQLQIRNVHDVVEEQKTTEEFIKMIDDKFIQSKGIKSWMKMAHQNHWLKE